MSSKRWFGLILGLLLVIKIGVNAQTVDWWYDGGYYADIARHVRDGHGFVTSVSMFHEGLPYFPFPSAVYPAWPWLLGMVSRAVPLDVAAVWLPTTFYLGTVALMWPLGRRLLPGPVIAELPGLDAGHLLMLLWGLANRFVESTSRPYTEGLGFFLLTVAILRWRRVVERPGLGAGVEAGLWCTAIVLVRGPFAVVSGAVLLFLWARVLIAGSRGARREAGAAALGATLAAAASAWLAQRLWFDGIPAANLGTLVRFDAWVVAPGLTPVDLLLGGTDLGDLVADRLGGVAAAFMFGGRYGYFLNFGYAHYGFVVLGAALLPELRRRGAWSALRELSLPDRPWLALVLAIGLAQMAALQVIHKAVFAEWNFGMRHALGILWWFGPTLILLVQRTDSWRLVGRFLLSASLGMGLMDSAQRRGVVDFGKGKLAHRQAVAAWLMGSKAEDPDVRVGHTDPQLIVRWTEGVGFITLHAFTTLEDLCLMARRDGLDYVVLPERTAWDPFDFLADKELFAAAWEEVPAGLGGTRVYRLRDEGCPSGGGDG